MASCPVALGVAVELAEPRVVVGLLALAGPSWCSSTGPRASPGPAGAGPRRWAAAVGRSSPSRATGPELAQWHRVIASEPAAASMSVHAARCALMDAVTDRGDIACRWAVSVLRCVKQEQALDG